MSALKSEHFQDSGLRGEDGSSTNCTNFNRGHRTSHQQVFAAVSSTKEKWIRMGPVDDKGGTHGSIKVIHIELSTFCAGSCPVARNMAVRMLLA